MNFDYYYKNYNIDLTQGQKDTAEKEYLESISLGMKWDFLEFLKDWFFLGSEPEQNTEEDPNE